MSKRQLVYVPIEPLEERYTKQWFDKFPEVFANAGFEVILIDGQAIRDFVKVGTFLDITSTVHYKMSQLQTIARMFDQGEIEDGAVFFFGDIEFWGIESVRLMADMMRISVTLTGFLHAASYTMGDAFEIAAPYQQFTEVGWIAAMDKVFVGSQYHKEAVISRRLSMLNQESLADRIVVSGNPLFADAYHAFNPPIQKKKQICLTNRFDMEKDIDLTLDLFEKAKVAHPDWNFVITTGRKTLRSNAPTLELKARRLAEQGVLEIREGLTKMEYHHTLAESLVMVSHSPEENFGYCVVEAAHYNCQPLLRVAGSHYELVQGNSKHLFGSKEEALAKLEELVNNPRDVKRFAEPFFHKPFKVILENL